MKRMISVAAGLLFGCVVVASEADDTSSKLTDARRILTKAQATIKRAKLVSYRADYTATGWVAPYVAKVQGTVVIGKQSKWEIDRFHCNVKLQKPESSETLEFTAGSDGEVFFLVDPKTKTAYQDIDPAVLGSNDRDIQRVLMRDLGAAEPFSDLLKGESLKLEGTEMIGGEECYKIRAKLDTPPEQVWFIAQKDSLPRRIMRVYPNRQDPEGETGATQLTISDVMVDPKLIRNPFKLVVPQGYAKTDDFAP